MNPLIDLAVTVIGGIIVTLLAPKIKKGFEKISKISGWVKDSIRFSFSLLYFAFNVVCATLSYGESTFLFFLHTALSIILLVFFVWVFFSLRKLCEVLHNLSSDLVENVAKCGVEKTTGEKA